MVDDRTPRTAPADPEDAAPSGACEGGVALAVPPVRLAPAFQMLGSDDVGVCVDGVCAVPTPAPAPPGESDEQV